MPNHQHLFLNNIPPLHRISPLIVLPPGQQFSNIGGALNWNINDTNSVWNSLSQDDQHTIMSMELIEFPSRPQTRRVWHILLLNFLPYPEIPLAHEFQLPCTAWHTQTTIAVLDGFRRTGFKGTHRTTTFPSPKPLVVRFVLLRSTTAPQKITTTTSRSGEDGFYCMHAHCGT